LHPHAAWNDKQSARAFGRSRRVTSPPGATASSRSSPVTRPRASSTTNDTDAHVEITIYFSDRDPVGPYRVTVGARRTKHVRFNDLSDPEPIPHATDYSSVIVSDVPIVVQHTRLDSRQSENALLTTMAWAAH
jgi:hypothetical protein